MSQQSQHVSNFTDYFKNARDIFVQNISDCQVSLEFKSPSGDVTPVLLRRSRDPVNLTQQVSFEDIKSSASFRRLVNRVPSVIRLMTEADYNGYYEQKAKIAGKSVDDVIREAEVRRQNNQAHIADLKEVAAKTEAFDDAQSPDKLEMKMADVVHPRVMTLCQQVSADVPNERKLGASDLLEELKTLNLKEADLEYVQSHGYWKSVKKWAAAELAAKSANGEEGDGLSCYRL